MANMFRHGHAADNKYEVIVNPEAGDNTVNSANVVMWSPFHVKITLWDPEMLIYSNLMKNKSQRKERDAFVYNAKRMFELCEKLGNEAVYKLLLRRYSKKRQAWMAMIIIAFLWLIVAFFHPLVAVILTIIHIVLFNALLNQQLAMNNKLLGFFAYREETFEQRMNDYLENSLKSHSMIFKPPSH